MISNRYTYRSMYIQVHLCVLLFLVTWYCGCVVESEYLGAHYYLKDSNKHLMVSEVMIHTSIVEEIPHIHGHVIVAGKGLGNLYDLIRPLRQRDLGMGMCCCYMCIDVRGISRIQITAIIHHHTLLHTHYCIYITTHHYIHITVCTSLYTHYIHITTCTYIYIYTSVHTPLHAVMLIVIYMC